MSTYVLSLSWRVDRLLKWSDETNWTLYIVFYLHLCHKYLHKDDLCLSVSLSLSLSISLSLSLLHTHTYGFILGFIFIQGIPYVGGIPGGMKDGRQIIINGMVPHHEHRYKYVSSLYRKHIRMKTHSNLKQITRRRPDLDQI